jgi:hypothetical protein
VRPQRIPAIVVALALLVAACAATAPSPSPRQTPAPASSTSSLDALPSAIPHAPAAAVDDALREELLAMLAQDQAVRTGIPLPGDDRTAEELFADMDAVDARNGARMAEILAVHGWPGWSLVGEDGAEAAWALVQHADRRPDLQEDGLALLRGAVEAGDASPGDLAYLVDRFLVGRNLPQRYGTQLGGDANGNLVPRTPIEDEANVDARRAEAGLEPLAEYMDAFRRAMEEPAPSP